MVHRLPLGHVPIHEFLDDLSLSCLAQTNTHMYSLFNQNTIPEVHSDEVSATKIHNFSRNRIRTLVVIVKESWGPPTTDKYHIPSLRCLVLKSTTNHKDHITTIPRPLEQWMPQLRTLDVRGLVNRGDIDELFETFPRQRLKEFKIETFGLQRLSELASGDPGFLVHVQSIHVTMTEGGHMNNHPMVWLMDWVQSGHGCGRRRLTFVFPLWNRRIHNQLYVFVESATMMRLHATGLPLLHIVIQNVDVSFIAAMSNNTLSLVQNPFVVFCDSNTNIRFFIQIENMEVSTASWLSILAMPLTHTAAIETVVQLNFTDGWEASYSNLFALTRMMNNLVRYHVIKALRTLPMHYTNDSTCNVFSDLLRGEARIRINVHGLQNHRLELARIPTEEHICEQMTRYGYIHCAM